MNNNPKSRKGIPNKDTSFIVETCARLKCDPIEFMCHVVNGDWKALGYKKPTQMKVGLGGKIVEEEIIQLSDRTDCAKKLADFIYPKRKAIEITGDNAGEKGFVLAYNPAALKREKPDEPKN